jgi:transcriptional regulator with XRE-family HTH domain
VSPQSPTVRSRRLRMVLRRLREDRDLTLAFVANELDWTAAKLSRLEGGQRGAHPNDIRVLTEVYGLSGEERNALIQLAREAKQRGWWQPYGSALPSGFETYVGLETEASSIATYQPELVPGIMQTEDYARAQMQAAPVAEAQEEIDKRIAVRLTRQLRLTQSEPLALWVILNEAVLYREVGSRETLRQQLRRLLDLAEITTVTLQVLPFASGAHPGTHGSFMALRFPEPTDADVVYIEHLTGRAYLEEPEEIARYNLVFDHLRANALSPHASTELIRTSIRSA